MSTYTTQLRWPIERKQHQTGVSPDDYSTCYEMLGLDDYPIFDEDYRQVLNDKIIRHYYFREIGFETVAQFRWYMRNTMHENMPYFNQLYNSLNLITDPITNRKYTWHEIYQLNQGGTTDTGVGTSESMTDEKAMDDHSTTDYGKTEETTIDYGKVDTTTTTYGKKTDTGTTAGTSDSTTTKYGRTDREVDSYGKTEHDVAMTSYGKTEHDVATTSYGKTEHDVVTTNYGRTQHTQNGGADTNMEGATHERVIHSDTPMNQISNSGVEGLNYASDVTYTDRNGTGVATTTYGGTTDVTNGGSDTTTSDSTTGGSDTKTSDANTGGSDTTTSNFTTGGSDTKTKTAGGSDVVSGSANSHEDVEVTTSGTDKTVDTLSGSDVTSSELGGSDTTTRTQTQNETRDTTGSSDTHYSRELDEDGTKEHTSVGYEGISPSDLLEKYRKTFINVDVQVINSLNILFLGVWT